MKSTGIITSRVCPRCGHHEVGFTTKAGIFHPLRPGTPIQVLEDIESPLFHEGGEGRHEDTAMGNPPSAAPGPGPMVPFEPAHATLDEQGDEDGFVPDIWIPEPLRGDRMLRLKFGVPVGERPLALDISPEFYQEAYLAKVRGLIEREIHVPWAVLLDRFFTAPHLAEGDPKEIAKAMWEELDEVKEPVILVSDWLINKDEESLAKMIFPRSKSDLGDQPLSDDDLRREFAGLSLEEFLEML